MLFKREHQAWFVDRFVESYQEVRGEFRSERLRFFFAAGIAWLFVDQVQLVAVLLAGDEVPLVDLVKLTRALHDQRSKGPAGFGFKRNHIGKRHGVQFSPTTEGIGMRERLASVARRTLRHAEHLG